MLPKKKTKELKQTKLCFSLSPAKKTTAAAASPQTLFTVEAPCLEPHVAILKSKQDNLNRPAVNKNTTPSLTSFSNLSKTPQISDNKDLSSKNSQALTNGSSDSLSVRGLTPSIPLSKTTCGYETTTVSGENYEYISECIQSDSWTDKSSSRSSVGGLVNVSEDASQIMSESRKRKAATELDRQMLSHGSGMKLVELDCDSEEEVRQSLKSSSSVSSHKIVGSFPGPGSVSKMSLLEQMTTPRGTRPLPRTANLLNARGQSMGSGRTYSRPSLTSSGSQVSDDGFTSASSFLDNKMQGFLGSQEPEILPPLSQISLNRDTHYTQKLLQSLPQTSSSQQQQQSQQGTGYSSSQVKTQDYSQNRSGDFTALSKGGNKKRVLPPSISGYQTTPSIRPGFHLNSKALSASARSRSSSPASSPLSASSYEVMPNSQDTSSFSRTKDGMLLSDEQQYVLQQIITYNKNVFFTGSAGTGKSVLLRELIYRLRSKYNNSKSGRDYWESANDSVAVTASTGIAACNIGGCTLHSFAGVGLGQDTLPSLQAKVRKNNTIVRRWQDTKVLIIDEVSMIDADFMDKLEALARFIRRNESPWGGIQVVLTGDFFQLPPVSKGGNAKFCFEGESWSRSITETIQLRQVFRQKDQAFADMLNEMRLGQMSPGTLQRFRSLARELQTKDGLRPTELFPLRNQVEEANNRMLNNLSGKTVVFLAKDRGPMKEKMEQNCLAPTTLHLKVNAQVMLLRNQSGGASGLVNGSIGILVGFVTKPADNENQVGSDGLRRGSLNTPGEELPLVRFTLESGATREMVVGREEWKIELPNGDLQGARVQIPLGLAWSLSIHKSQGQTLPKVRVDLGRVFEKGQAYVALSRATSLDGLQVLNFDPKKVMVHSKVVEFYRNLRVYVKVDTKREET